MQRVTIHSMVFDGTFTIPLYSIFQWSTMNGYLYMYVSLLITQKAAIAIDHAP